MTDFPTLIDSGAGLTGLDDELALLKALADITGKWRELARALNSPDDFVVLLDRIATDLGTDQVKAAFGAVGLDGAHGTLTALIGKIRDVEGRIPGRYKQLFKPLSAYGDSDAGAVEWGLSGDRETQVGGKVKLGVTGSVKLQFAAAARARIGETEESRLLRLGIGGEVKADASGKLPIRWGSIEGSVGASVAVGLDYYYKPADIATPYGIAVADRILHLPDPFDYESIWKAFQSDRGLEGIVYRFDDTTNAKASLALSATGNLIDDVLADVKLTIGASADIDNRFLLSLRAVPAPAGSAGSAGRQIEIMLGRTSAFAAGVSLGIEVKLDASAMLGRVREILNRAVARSNAILGKITPYLTPGTWLREQAGAEIRKVAGTLLDDPALAGLRDALAGDIEAALGGGAPDEAAIVRWLSDRLTDAIDGGARDFTEAGDGLVDKLVARISGALPVPAALEASFVARAKGALGPLVDRVAGAFREELGKLIAPTGDALREALKEVNIDVAGRIDTIDKALAPVRKLIDEYNRVLELARDFASDTARARISASLKIEELWTWGEEERIVGTFVSGQAGETFRRIATGDVAGLKALLLDGGPTPGFELDRPRSHLKRSAQRTGKAGFDLVVFGFGESGSLLLDGKAEILIDGDGNVQVDARGELKNRFKTSTEEREVSFVDTFSLKLARAADGTPLETRAIEVGVSIAHVDKKLELKELTGFIRSLCKAGLVSGAAATIAEAQYRLWAPDGKPIAADVSAKLQLTPAQIRRFMHIGMDDRDGGRLTDAVVETLIRKAVAAGEDHGRHRGDIRVGATRVAQSHDWAVLELDDFLCERIRNLRRGREMDLREEYRGKGTETSGPIRSFLKEYQRMLALIAIVQRLGDIYNAVPGVNAASPPGAWDEKRYAEQEHALAQDCSKWLHTGGGGFKISDDVAAVTVTFLATVCDLVGIVRPTDEPAPDIMALTFSGTPPGETARQEVPLTEVVRGLPPP
jgi:hypothetical protein